MTRPPVASTLPAMTLVLHTWWPGAPSGAGACADRGARQPVPLVRRPARVFFFCHDRPQSPPTCSPRSGRTSACARAARALVPARVGRAGPARALLVRRLAARGSSTSTRPRRSGSRSSATSATTASRSSSRRCRCRTTGPGCPESRFVVADTLVRFDHVARHRRGAARRRATRSTAPLAAGAARRRRARRALRRFPDQAEHERRVERAKEYIRARRRVPDRRLAARRAADVGVARSSSTARCAASTRRRTSSCSSSTAFALVGSSPETLVKCEGARAELNPIAGTIAPGEGDAERCSAPRRTARST